VKADPAGSRRHTAFAQLPGWVFVPNIPGLSGNIDRMINPSGLQAQYAPHKVRDNYAEANGPRSGTAPSVAPVLPGRRLLAQFLPH
jgi:hypothetical protein